METRGSLQPAVPLARLRQYRLVEFAPDGRPCVEGFVAPDDEVALARALDVAQGPTAELWRGGELIQRWEVDPSAPTLVD